LALSAGLLLVDMALGSQRWAPLSVVTFPRLKKNMAIWIRATKNAYCYVQYWLQ
jgi:hypothetical protein